MKQAMYASSVDIVKNVAATPTNIRRRVVRAQRLLEEAGFLIAQYQSDASVVTPAWRKIRRAETDIQTAIAHSTLAARAIK